MSASESGGSRARSCSDQRRTGAVVNRSPQLGRLLGEGLHGPRDQGVVIRHSERDSTALAVRGDRLAPRNGAAAPPRQPSKGFCTRIVSSRSGLVESSATGAPISSSMRRTYLIACAGRSAQERAPARRAAASPRSSRRSARRAPARPGSPADSRWSRRRAGSRRTTLISSKPSSTSSLVSAMPSMPGGPHGLAHQHGVEPAAAALAAR